MAVPTVLSSGDLTVTSRVGWDDETAQALRTYVANPLFRAATFDELLVDDNPYRRPVRPDDLKWLSFAEPITAQTSSRLSALLGHRMLLNIYDATRPMMPDAMSEERWHDFDLFYGEQNLAYGERVRPFLEQHLFGFVTDTAISAANASHLSEQVEALVAERDAAARRLAEALAASTDGARVRTMTAIQMLGPSLVTPRRQDLATFGGPDDAVLLRRLSNLVAVLGLSEHCHRYYQFYLPSTLALMNYLGGYVGHPRQSYRLAGALHAYRTDLAARLSVVDLGSAAPSPRAASPVDLVARAVEHRGGPHGVRDFARGLSEFGQLLAVHDEDLVKQLHLIDATEANQRKAQRLYAAINEHNIPVALDTFVESWEECSTTHVHDDDRLVVIESGEMEFWTCVGQRIVLRPGEMTFVPKHRLHGSVVQSGQCVYHQPVITPAVDELYG